MLDFHNHLMPGVDDGAVDLDESRVGLDMLRSQGITDIVTTPHIRASLTERPRELGIYLGVIDRAFERLRNLAEAEFPEIRLERGVEMMLDIPHPDLSDPRLRLAGTTFALVEFPFMSIPPHSTRAVGEIVEQGWTPVIAHPERHLGADFREHLVALVGLGALIQVTASHVLSDDAGPALVDLAVRGLAHLVASDAHSARWGRPVAVRAAIDRLEREAGAEVAAFARDAPAAILRGEDPEPSQPVAAPTDS